jgi:hypothetical protein
MSALIPGGYILLARKLMDSGIMEKPPEYLKVFIYLLLKARHDDNCILKRGQGFTSIPELMEKLSYKVGYRTEKISKKKIWNILEWLRFPDEGDNEGNAKVTMIVTTKVTHGITYTISNYEHYQNPKNYEGNNEGNNEKPTKELRREEIGNNIKKNVKETKKKEIYGEFQNVFLTQEEYDKLIQKLGNENTVNKWIEKVSGWQQSKGKKNKDHYATILTWVRNSGEDQPVKDALPAGQVKTIDGAIFPKYRCKETPEGWVFIK